jgi:hypothetical protein
VNPQRLNRYLYASDNPLIRLDIDGLSDIIFDGLTHLIYLYDSKGNLIAYDRAFNNAVSGHSKIPDGRYQAMDQSEPHRHGTNNSTDATKDASKGKDTFGPQGIIRIVPPSPDPLRVAGDGVHAGGEDTPDQLGRTNEERGTNGCIRTTECFMDAAAATMASDPLNSVAVQNNEPSDSANPSPAPSMSTLDTPTDCAEEALQAANVSSSGSSDAQAGTPGSQPTQQLVQ